MSTGPLGPERCARVRMGLKGGGCMWGINSRAVERYTPIKVSIEVAVDLKRLNISLKIKVKLFSINNSIIDWAQQTTLKKLIISLTQSLLLFPFKTVDKIIFLLSRK